jgi:hypothetical protein
MYLPTAVIGANLLPTAGTTYVSSWLDGPNLHGKASCLDGRLYRRDKWPTRKRAATRPPRASSCKLFLRQNTELVETPAISNLPLDGDIRTAIQPAKGKL